MELQDAKHSIRIMLVGCDNYENLKNLHSVKEDISRMNEIFCKSSYSIFTETNLLEVYNKPSSDFRLAIKDYLFSRAADREILILFFAGHGTAIGRDDFGFCMSDAVLHGEDSVIIPTSVVKLSEILDTLAIKDASLILIVDACYSGQVSKKMIISNPDISLAMSNTLVSHSGSSFGLITACSEYDQIADIGVISKALKDIFDQGIDGNFQYINFGALASILSERIDTHALGDARSRVFIPPGILSTLPLCDNVQYYVPPEPVNVYSFTKPYLKMMEALWNNGHPIKLTPGEILEKTGSQSAYANHNKLSFPIWDLLQDFQDHKRMLTPKGIQFVQGNEKIPKVIIENRKTRECKPAPGSYSICVIEEKNLFGETEKVFAEVEPYY